MIPRRTPGNSSNFFTPKPKSSDHERTRFHRFPRREGGQGRFGSPDLWPQSGRCHGHHRNRRHLRRCRQRPAFRPQRQQGGGGPRRTTDRWPAAHQARLRRGPERGRQGHRVHAGQPGQGRGPACGGPLEGRTGRRRHHAARHEQRLPREAQRVQRQGPGLGGDHQPGEGDQHDAQQPADRERVRVVPPWKSSTATSVRPASR